MNKTRRRTESFIVAGKDQITIPAAPTRLYDPTTLALNLNVGQLGIMSVSPLVVTAPYTFVDATPTVQEYPQIQFVSRVNQNLPYPLYNRPLEFSAVVDVTNIESVVRKDFLLGAHDIWTVGSIAPASAWNAANETNYSISVAFTGRDVEYFNSCEQAYMITANVTTPNFTLLGTANPVDWLIRHLVFNFNTSSKAFQIPKEKGNHPLVAFAVTDVAAGNTAIATLNPGNQVPVFVYGSTSQTLTVTEEMINSLQIASTKTGFTHIVNADLNTAGAAVSAKGILFMALDRDEVFDDDVIPIKNYLRVGLTHGFHQGLLSTKVVTGREGANYGYQLAKHYTRTAGQRKYAQRHQKWPIAEFPNPINVNERYTTFVVNHYKFDNFGHSSTTTQPMKEIIVIPSESAPGTPHAAIALVEGRLNSLLSSAGKAPVMLA